MNIHFSIRDRFSKCFNCFLESVSPLLIASFTFFAVTDLFFYILYPVLLRSIPLTFLKCSLSFPGIEKGHSYYFV